METSRTIGVDAILESLGSKGRWQVTQYILLAMHFLSTACVTLSIIFTGYGPAFHCALDPDESVTNSTRNITRTSKTDECTVYSNITNTSIGCVTGFVFDAHRTDLTIVTEWDLVCDRAFLNELSQSMMYVGLGFGSLFGTPLADKFGRRKIYLVCEVCLFAIGLGTAFSPNIAVFIILKAVSGAISVAGNQAASIASMELFPVKHRTLVGTFLGLNWALGLIIYSGMAYAMRNLSWRQHQIILSTVSILVTASFFFTDESLRWLLASGKRKDAANILKKASRINKVPLEIIRRHIRDSHAEESDELDALLSKPEADGQPNGHEWVISHESCHDENKEKDLKLDTDDECEGLNKESVETEIIKHNAKENVLTLFKHSKLRFRTLAMAWGWLVNTLTYYGIYLMSGTLTDNRYLEFFLNALVEIPAIFMTLFMLKRFGRRVPCIIFHVSCGLSLLLAGIIDNVQVFLYYTQAVLHGICGLHFVHNLDDSNIPVTVLAIIGKFWITASFALLVVLTPELFPTNIRTSAYGITSGTSRVGGMIAPFLRTLGKLVSWAPGAIFATCCVSMGVCAYYLPETARRELPQSVAEVDAWNMVDSKENKTNKCINDNKLI